MASSVWESRSSASEQRSDRRGLVMPHIQAPNIKISSVRFKLAKTDGRPMGQLYRLL
jgi:hypothetical protein